MTKIIGIDTLPGASSIKTHSLGVSRFAAVVMENEKIIEAHDSISIKNIVHLCRQYEPNFLAVDNIFELEPNSARIIKFCGMLPLNTKVLQVTGAPPDGFEPLNRLARRYNISYPSQHASPVVTAEIICKLAEKNIGYILTPFEDETEIKISRSRAIGPGGWSQQRYSRKMRGEILTISREVEKQLRDNNIDFDLEIQESEFGYENAIFRAYTSQIEVRKIIKPFRGELSRIVIFPIRKKRLEFIPAFGLKEKYTAGLTKKIDRGLIVGIDPGPNTGIAILNFSGKILFVESLRSVARGDVIRKLIQFGDPTIIAADVSPPPEFVVKISKMLNATLSFPEKLLSAEEKNHIVNIYTFDDTSNIKGAHSRDALCAAIKAFSKYNELFVRIDKALLTPNELPLRNQVKQIVVREERNIQEAIDEVKKALVKEEKIESIPKE